jgi:RNA recognition motif-containing protein
MVRVCRTSLIARDLASILSHLSGTKERQEMKKIYVGNMPWSIDDDALAALFESHGEVLSAKVISDRETGRSRGFGFVEMDDANATAAIEGLEGHAVDGRTLVVNEARPRPDRGGRGGGGGGGRGGYGGGGGGGGYGGGGGGGGGYGGGGGGRDRW